MTPTIIVAHAKNEEARAEILAKPLREAGFEVMHAGTLLVGESLPDQVSKMLSAEAAVVLCGTIQALGTSWARRVLNAARVHTGARVFIVQMEEDADTDSVSYGEVVAKYWQDPTFACTQLLASLRKHFAVGEYATSTPKLQDAETRYRAVALRSCDIIDLANLPDDDRHLASRELELRRLYVALRMRVEVSADEEVHDDALVRVERRRRSAWAGGIRQSSARRQDTGVVSLGERLKEARRLVVLGDPGAGKSTLLRWLATAYLLRLKSDPDWLAVPDVASLPAVDWLPIIVRCRDLPTGASTLDEMLHHTLRKAEFPGPECDAMASILRERLRAGTALLLIDGLDEISDALDRARFAEQIEKIHIAIPDAPMVVTSRIVGYRDMGHRIRHGFEHLTVAELSARDKDDFIRRWCGLTERPERRVSAADELIRDIRANDRIARLTGNPMLLTTMALVKRKVGRLPQRRLDLYEKAVEVLLNWRSEVDVPLERREALPQLEYIAFAMCDRGMQQIREDEIVDLLRRMRSAYPRVHAVHARAPEEFLSLLESRTGILVQAGHERYNGVSVPVYEFRHLTFQEYLAALALIQGYFPDRDAERKLADYVGDLVARFETVGPVVPDEDAAPADESHVTEIWREPIRLCIAACNDDDADDAIIAVLGSGGSNESASSARLMLASLCLADDPNVSAETAERVLLCLVASAAGDHHDHELPGPVVDDVAIALAGSQWGARLIALLLRDFCEGDPRKRWWWGSLFSIVSSADAPRDEAGFRAWMRSHALKVINGAERDAIAGALTVMQVAFEGRMCSSNDLVEALIQRLSGSAAMSHAAAWALGWMKSLARENDAWVPSYEQLESIARIAGKVSFDSEAIRFIAIVFKGESAPSLLNCMLVHIGAGSEFTRLHVIGAIGSIRDGRAVDALISCVEEPDASPSVVEAALAALGEIRDARALGLLAARWSDSSAPFKVRLAAADGLAKVAGEQAVALLVGPLQNVEEQTHVRAAAARALGETKSGQAVGSLLAQLEDSTAQKEVRVASALALGIIKDERSTDGLLLRWEDDAESAIVRQAVAGVLGHVGGPRVVASLLKYWSAVELDLDLRCAAGRALGEIGGEESRAALATALADEADVVRRTALGGLLAADERARRLFSRDLDGIAPFLDPAEPIEETHLLRASEQLRISEDELREIYEAAADGLGLKVGWARGATTSAEGAPTHR